MEKKQYDHNDRFWRSNLRIFHMLELYHVLAILRFLPLFGDGEFTLSPLFERLSHLSLSDILGDEVWSL